MRGKAAAAVVLDGKKSTGPVLQTLAGAAVAAVSASRSDFCFFGGGEPAPAAVPGEGPGFAPAGRPEVITPRCRPPLIRWEDHGLSAPPRQPPKPASSVSRLGAASKNPKSLLPTFPIASSLPLSSSLSATSSASSPVSSLAGNQSSFSGNQRSSSLGNQSSSSGNRSFSSSTISTAVSPNGNGLNSGAFRNCLVEVRSAGSEPTASAAEDRSDSPSSALSPSVQSSANKRGSGARRGGLVEPSKASTGNSVGCTSSPPVLAEPGLVTFFEEGLTTNLREKEAHLDIEADFVREVLQGVSESDHLRAGLKDDCKLRIRQLREPGLEKQPPVFGIGWVAPTHGEFTTRLAVLLAAISFVQGRLSEAGLGGVVLIPDVLGELDEFIKTLTDNLQWVDVPRRLENRQGDERLCGGFAAQGLRYYATFWGAFVDVMQHTAKAGGPSGRFLTEERAALVCRVAVAALIGACCDNEACKKFIPAEWMTWEGLVPKDSFELGVWNLTSRRLQSDAGHFLLLFPDAADVHARRFRLYTSQACERELSAREVPSHSGEGIWVKPATGMMDVAPIRLDYAGAIVAENGHGPFAFKLRVPEMDVETVEALCSSKSALPNRER